MTTEEIMPILQKISILGGMSDDQLARVLKLMHRESYPAGQKIFQQGESGDRIYVVLTGEVKIVCELDGAAMELVVYGVGQCFGETAVIGILPHSASAWVIADCEVLVLPSRAVHVLYHDDPTTFGLLILNIAREACRRLYRTDEILLHYANHRKGGPNPAVHPARRKDDKP